MRRRTVNLPMGVKPRVTIVTPGSYPIPSSKSSSVENAVMHIAAFASRRVSLWVLGKKTEELPSVKRTDGVRYVHPVLTKQRPTYVRAALGAIEKLRPDIIQIENRPSFVLAFKRRHPNSKVWLSLYSTTFLAKSRIRQGMLRKSLARADCIVVNSRFLKDYVANKYPETAGKIRVNHLGVDTAQFISRWSPEGESARMSLLKELGCENNKILLYVGRLIKKKGVHHLLSAMPAIIDKHPDAVLLIVGSADYGVNRATPYVKSLRALGKSMPCEVRFIKYVPHDQVHRWFCLADMVIVPSFEKEAFGLVILEAMACGVPVIATKAGGMKELIVNGETGFLFSPWNIPEGIAEKANLLLDQPELVRQMGEAGIRRVSDLFTWEHAASRMVDWYCAAVRPDSEKRGEQCEKKAHENDIETAAESDSFRHSTGAQRIRKDRESGENSESHHASDGGDSGSKRLYGQDG